MIYTVVVTTFVGHSYHRQTTFKLSKGDIVLLSLSVELKEISSKVKSKVIPAVVVGSKPVKSEYPYISTLLKRSTPQPVTEYGGIICEFVEGRYTYWNSDSDYWLAFADSREAAIDKLRQAWTAKFFDTVN